MTQRIIDANELPVVNSIERIDGKQVQIESWIPARAIVNAPTVEAVPVEWIKETIKLAERVRASEYAKYLRILLRDWEEEKWKIE